MRQTVFGVMILLFFGNLACSEEESTVADKGIDRVYKLIEYTNINSTECGSNVANHGKTATIVGWIKDENPTSIITRFAFYNDTLSHTSSYTSSHVNIIVADAIQTEMATKISAQFSTTSNNYILAEIEGVIGKEEAMLRGECSVGLTLDISASDNVNFDVTGYHEELEYARE